MISLGLNDIHFPIAAQKVFTCTEAASCAPEGPRPVEVSICRFLPATPLGAHPATGTRPISPSLVQRDFQNDSPVYVSDSGKGASMNAQ